MLQKLTILGTGTIIPDPGRKCAGYLLETDNDLILIDCGPGTLCQLAEIGTDISRIKYIFLTHFHLDHISDLFAVLHSRWLRGVHENDVINITGPYGLAEMMINAREYFFKNEKWISHEKIKIREAGESFFKIKDLSVKTLFTHHTLYSLCYRFEDSAGKSFFFSGDSDYNENIIALGNDTTVAVIECSHSDSCRNYRGHMNVLNVIEYSKNVKTGKLLLSHFYPDFLHSKDFSLIKQMKNITIANDLDTYLFY